MSKQPREAVVSVRISEEDQARLRQLAAARGTSVSELVRSFVVREVNEPARQPASSGATSGFASPTTGTTTAASLIPVADQGVFWDVEKPSTVSGSTITLRS
jgi:hypothetical protein